MANRRMFASSVLTTDRFQSMSRDSQFLYIHLGMNADDDGFLGSPLLLTKMISCTEENLKELKEKGYLIFFESGVCVITHWKLNNYIQKDRYTETVYTEEKSHLSIGENGAYSYSETPCIPSVYSMDTQVSLNEVKEDKVIDSLEKERELVSGETYAEAETKADTDEALRLGAYKNVFLKPKDYEKLKQKFPADYEAMIENLSEKLHLYNYSYPDHYITLLKWAKEDASRKKYPPRTTPPAESSPYDVFGESPRPQYDFAAIERKAFLNVHKQLDDDDDLPETPARKPLFDDLDF